MRTQTVAAVLTIAGFFVAGTAPSAQSAGVRTATSAGTSTAGTSPVRFSLAHRDWTSSDAFSQLNALRVLSNGSVLVADGMDIEVRLIDATGKVTRQIGRKGSGPAEYTSPALLIALPADSTLLLDLGARRFLIIDPRGQVVKTEVISQALGAAGETIAGSDPAGRLYFGQKLASQLNGIGASEPIARWTRGTDRFDTITMFRTENPKVRPAGKSAPGLKEQVSQTREVFAAVDDWVVAPSGKIAIIHAEPYRVDWVSPNGKVTPGKPVTVTRVPVTEADRKEREPDGPPYKRAYAALKSPFVSDIVVVDNEDNVWVARSEAAQYKNRRWDVFGSNGVLRATVLLPRGRKLMAVTAAHLYISYTDADGLQWIERYSRSGR